MKCCISMYARYGMTLQHLLYKCMARQTQVLCTTEWKAFLLSDWLANSLAHTSLCDPIAADLRRSLHCTGNFIRLIHLTAYQQRIGHYFWYQHWFDQLIVCNQQYEFAWLRRQRDARAWAYWTTNTKACFAQSQTFNMAQTRSKKQQLFSLHSLCW